MSSRFANWDENTLELAALHVTDGLGSAEREHLYARADEVDLAEFERVVAEFHVGSLEALETPPAEVLQRLEERARAFLNGNGARPATSGTRELSATHVPGPRPVLSPILAFGGWLAAAVLLAAFLLNRSQEAPGSVDVRREVLLASTGDLVRVDWSPTADPLAEGASGDVVWSKARQEGYMRFRNLTPNDPAEAQYQLWIFDTSRADWEAKPVDGGVFDVGPGGEVVVPIDPKLEIGDVALFAVTLEVPGGVVVSEREHLVLTAAI